MTLREWLESVPMHHPGICRVCLYSGLPKRDSFVETTDDLTGHPGSNPGFRALDLGIPISPVFLIISLP